MLHDPPKTLRPPAVWRIELFGGLRAISGSAVITQFGSLRIAALLARLALEPQRVHPREELIDVLWPQVDAATGRNRLRHALSTLRRLLEPPGAGHVLLTDRFGVRLNPQAVTCDALQFEQLVRAGRHSEALALYRGELLPGFYDDWIQEQRLRLAAVCERIVAADQGGPAGSGAAGAVRPPLAGARGSGSDTPPAAGGDGLPAAPGVGMTLFPNRQVLVPSYLTAFFGRNDEAGELAALVRGRRLVTVSGPGGCGKTRLAVEVARALASHFETLLFVPLADIEQPQLICESMRQALRLPLLGQEAEAQLRDYLSDRAALLVLDNFEQLVGLGGAAVVERLLAALPRLHCLVTSRRVLTVAGECEFALAPLPLPDAMASAEEIAANPAAALFVDRARSARPGIQVTAGNSHDLARLLCALEGVPLAIELAASRIRAMSVAEMTQAIGRRRDWIARATPHAARDPRHVSLQAAIDWSWRLLDPAQQRFLCDLTAFSGGFSAEAAAAVGGCGDDSHMRLEALVADSLLQTQTDAWGGTRFVMLELIRDHAAARPEAGNLMPARARHRRFFLERLRRFARTDLARLVPDQANLEQALATALADGAGDDALDLAVALRPLADARGLSPRLVELAATVAAAAAETDERACRAHMLVAEAQTVACRLDAAAAHAERALALATEGLARAEATFIDARVWWERNLSALQHKAALEQALAVARQAGAAHLQTRLLNLLGNIATQDERDYGAAEALFTRSAGIAEQAGLRRLATQARHNLAIIERKRRRFEAAATLSDAVIDDCRRRSDVVLLADALHERGLMLAEMRQWPRSVAAFCECVRFCWEQRTLLTLAYALWNLARPLARAGQPLDAARLAGFAAAYWEQHGGPLSRQDRRYVRRLGGLAAATIGAARAQTALHAGAGLALREAVSLALRAGEAASRADERSRS